MSRHTSVPTRVLSMKWVSIQYSHPKYPKILNIWLWVLGRYPYHTQYPSGYGCMRYFIQSVIETL